MGISTEMLVYEDMTLCTDLPVSKLSIGLLHSAAVLHSSSYYTVVASIFLVSAASCKAICSAHQTCITWESISNVTAFFTMPPPAPVPSYSQS